MTEKEVLREAYEDALFALLMDNMVNPEEDFDELLARLETDPAADPPEGAYERSMAMIDRLCAQRRRKQIACSVRRVATKIVMAAALVAALLSTAFAVSEDFRVNTLNLLIEISDVSARLTLNGDSSAVPDREQTPADEAETGTSGDAGETFGVVLMGYQFPEVPEGFEVEFEKEDPIATRIQYQNPEGATIYFAVKHAEGIAHSVDTEGAQNIEDVIIHGYDGLLVEKDEQVLVVWLDTDNACFINIFCAGISKDVAEGLAEKVRYLGQ